MPEYVLECKNKATIFRVKLPESRISKVKLVKLTLQKWTLADTNDFLDTGDLAVAIFLSGATLVLILRAIRAGVFIEIIKHRFPTSRYNLIDYRYVISEVS